MIITPIHDVRQIGTNIELQAGTVYLAEPATNLPDYEEKGLVFCRGILLNSSEYRKINEDDM